MNIFDIEIKNILLEYCKYQDLSVWLSISDDEDADDGKFDEISERTLFISNRYLYNKIREIIIDNKLYKDLSDHDFSSKLENELKYDDIMAIFSVIGKQFIISTTAAGFGAHFNMNEILSINDDDYNERRLRYEMYLDHSLLLAGYLRHIMNEMGDIYIPHSLWGIIYSFYPKYEVYSFKIEGYDDLILTKPEKWFISAHCDNPEYIQTDSDFYFRSLNNKWYDIEEENLCYKMDVGLEAVGKNEQLIQYLCDEGVIFEGDHSVSFMYKYWLDLKPKRFMTCINDGDVVEFPRKYSTIDTDEMPSKCIQCKYIF